MSESDQQSMFSEDEIEDCIERNQKTNGVIIINYNKIARLILQHFPMATIVETKEMLVYAGGHYVPNGKELIHRCMASVLTSYVKDNGQTAYSAHALGEVTNIIQGLTYVEARRFDEDLEILNCKNGLLNWKTLEFKPHTPEYHSRIQLGVTYDPDARCPHIEDMFRIILQSEDLRKALELISYCLYRKYPIQKAFMLLGPGGTGKTHFMGAIRHMLSEENVSSVSMHDLEVDRFATSDLYLKLLNANGDLSQQQLPNVNTLKMLCSNEDAIRAQKKGERAFEFISFAKLIFGTNMLAKVRDDTTGFYRRVEIIPFIHVFSAAEKASEESRARIKAIEDPEELSGLLNWVLPYLEPLIDKGDFDNSFDSDTMRDTYKRASDPVASFVELCLEEVADEYVPKRAVYSAFVEFCLVNGIARKKKDVMHIVPFGKLLKTAMPWYHTGSRGDKGDRHMCLLDTALNPVEHLSDDVEESPS